jgi:signal transduction histidine kinase
VKLALPRPLPILLAALTVAAAGVLILSAVGTYRTLDAQRAVFLRGRAAAVSARLETIPPSLPESDWPQLLADEEPSLAALVLYDRPASPAFLEPLWDGRELFRTETVNATPPVFRAYVPFHSAGSLRIARIDIDEAAADFLIRPAFRHLWLVALGGLLIVVLTVLTVRGATRLAAAERRQLELQHLATLGEMSASLAHEIRNPLGTIKGFVQLLAEKLDGAHAPLVSPILSETSRLEQLVKDLLLYARPSQPSLRSVRSTEIEETLRGHALHLCNAPNLRFESSASPFSVETDPQLLEQVLLNLLGNAAEAVRSLPHGVVRLEMTTAGDCALLRILDNGPGLSGDAARRLFEPFFTTKASGTGLGLSISRKLVDSLGGHLTLEPRPSGGVCAEVLLPLHANA